MEDAEASEQQVVIVDSDDDNEDGEVVKNVDAGVIALPTVDGMGTTVVVVATGELVEYAVPMQVTFNAAGMAWISVMDEDDDSEVQGGWLQGKITMPSFKDKKRTDLHPEGRW